jgi:hypothetical protein
VAQFVGKDLRGCGRSSASNGRVRAIGVSNFMPELDDVTLAAYGQAIPEA